MTSKSKKIEVFRREVAYFVAAAEETSFNLAARRIGITQAALTLAIQRLEEELGVRLFHRGKKGVTLTALGRAAYESLSRLQAHTSRSLLHALSNPKELPLKVGAVEHFGTKYLFPLVDRATPVDRLQIYLMRSLQVYEAVKQGKLDLGFVTWSSIPKGVESRALHREPLCVVGLKKKFAHITRAKSIADLSDEPWIYTPKPQYDWTQYIDESAVGYVCGGFFSHVKAVMAGLGIAEAQLDAFSESEQKLLAFARFNAPRSALNYAIYRKGMSPEVSKRIEDLIRKMPG